ncbi:MAG: type II secretion system protein GspJ [Polyangia bacterium]|jgi:general secretion pathway protein J|nr:type II secretion system protein GspJ [Polyangia bacterium]
MTLIEVLVSMAVMAGIFVVIYATFDRTRRTYSEVTAIQDRWHVVRSGMHRMTQDLSMAYISVNEDLAAVNRRTYFRLTKGNYGMELRFSSFAHRRLYQDANESDQCIIQYFLAPDPDDRGKVSLFRRETRRLGNEEPDNLLGEAYVLIDDVEDLHFEFFDKPEDKWREEWDTTTVDGQNNRLPTQIRIHLTIRNEKDKPMTLVTMAQPALTDALSFVPSGAGATAQGGGGAKGRGENPFSEKWKEQLNRHRSSLGGPAGGGR